MTRRKRARCHICGRGIDTKTETHLWALGQYYICDSLECLKKWIQLGVKPE